MRRILKALFFAGLVVVAVVWLLVIFSPYGYNEETGRYELSNSVEISLPPSQVYEYLGNSAHAADWSDFVDHIIPLNPGEVPDGQVGSFRRCFKNADEKGLQWDEEIIKNEKDRCRRLTIFNLKSFPVYVEGLATEQVYEEISGRTRLTFSLFSLQSPGFFDRMRMYLGGYYVHRIFRVNMNNIKRIVENDGKV